MSYLRQKFTEMTDLDGKMAFMDIEGNDKDVGHEQELEDSGEDNLMGIYGDLLNEDDNMMRKNFLRSAKARKKEEKHPFLRYGTGIQNYFAMQERLIKLFCALTIIAIPQIFIYRYFEGFKNDYKDD